MFFSFIIPAENVLTVARRPLEIATGYLIFPLVASLATRNGYICLVDHINLILSACFFVFFLDPVARWLPGLNSQYIHCMGLDPIHSELLRDFSLIFRVRSHWVTNIAINCTTKFATKFVTKIEMGLIPIFATKYLRLSNLQMSMPSYSFNCVSNPFNFPHQCSTKLFTVMKWVWYLIEWGLMQMQRYFLNVNGPLVSFMWILTTMEITGTHLLPMSVS